MKLGDDYQYTIKGTEEFSYKLDSRKTMKMQDVLYIQGLKKNILSISSLDAKGFSVAFFYGQVLMWPRGKIIDDATIIGEKEGFLYKLKGQKNKHWFITLWNQENYGTKVFHMYTTYHYQLQAKQY